MPKPALAFASIVALSGAGVLGAAWFAWLPLSPAPFLVLAALALLAATFKVRIPGMTGAISPVSVPILFVAGTLGWQAAAVIAAAAGILQCVWRPKSRPSLLQAAFNGAALALSAVVAVQAANLVTPPGAFAWFMAAAVVSQIANVLLVSLILSLLGEGVSLASLWRNCHLWSFPYELAAGAFAALWAQAGPQTATSLMLCGTIALAGALLYLMNVFYRGIVDRTGAGGELTTR
jgi:hypothetical protein